MDSVGDVKEKGVVPCIQCGEPHEAVVISVRPTSISWAHRDDGHRYFPMSAEQLAIQLAEARRALA